MFGDRAREQRPHRVRGLDQPLRPRRGAEGQQPRRDRRQERQMIIRFRRLLERDAQQRRPARREGCRKDGIAFDDAGIAVGGALARAAAVDQRDRQAALGEVHRDAGADNAGSEHDGIGARHTGLRRGRLSSGHNGGGIAPIGDQVQCRQARRSRPSRCSGSLPERPIAPASGSTAQGNYCRRHSRCRSKTSRLPMSSNWWTAAPCSASPTIRRHR